MPTVAIDVGHTLADPGARSARGRDEFSYNLALAGVLAERLHERGIAVRHINFGGDVAHLAERPRLAGKVDLFVSVHHDSARSEHLDEWDVDGEMRAYSDIHRGFSLFVSRLNPQPATSLRCASAIGARLRRTGFAPTFYHADRRPLLDASNAVHAYDRLIVLYRTTLPALLFEAGVIKHREEELALRDPQRIARMADAVATGIAACLASGDRAAARR